MHDTENSTTSAKRVPWNKGKLTGAKPPLRPKHVWAIRTKLQIDQLTRDLALFSLAIDPASPSRSERKKNMTAAFQQSTTLARLRSNGTLCRD